MGGRGGSSGLSSSGTSGLDVIKNGETTRYYFSNKNGRHYYQIGIGGAPQPTIGVLMENQRVEQWRYLQLAA